MIDVDRLTPALIHRFAEKTTEESHSLLRNLYSYKCDTRGEFCRWFAFVTAFGNLRYALTLPLRIIALVKDTLMFAVRLAVNIIFLPLRWRHILPDLRDASIALVGSIMHVAINVLGIVASPLAYRLDSALLMDTPTLVQRALLKHCFFAHVAVEKSDIQPPTPAPRPPAPQPPAPQLPCVGVGGEGQPLSSQPPSSQL